MHWTLAAMVRSSLIISNTKWGSVVLEQVLVGELTREVRLRIINLTLSVGWIFLRENEEVGRPVGRGTMEGKER